MMICRRLENILGYISKIGGKNNSGRKGLTLQCHLHSELIKMNSDLIQIWPLRKAFGNEGCD